MTKNSIRLFATVFLAIILMGLSSSAQERIVKVDFESNALVNNPSIPFDEPFIIQGEMGKEIEFVDVIIRNEGSDWNLHRFSWNRILGDEAGTFNIVVPPVLTSNSKYDIEVITYTKLGFNQKKKLVKNLRNRIAFYISNSFYFDGKNVSLKKPKKVYAGLQKLVNDALCYQVSKNGISNEAPSKLILDELEKQRGFKFKKMLKGSKSLERNDVAIKLIADKVNLITDMVISEIMPFINTELAQQYRVANVKSVKTDKERFTLPVNVGIYAWNTDVSISNESEFKNTDFTFGAGITIPFMNKSRFASKSKMFDSFGLSMGVLFSPLESRNGIEYVTPGIDLPVYTALGFRLFKVIRFNAGVIIAGEKGTENFNGLTITPTVGLALELDLWLGVKR